jgi:hypothetical protein
MPDPTVPSSTPGEASPSNERLDVLEQRLEDFEMAQRLSNTEQRLDELENEPEESATEDASPQEGEGQKALRLATAAFLTNETVIKAVSDIAASISGAITEWSGSKAKEIEAQKAVFSTSMLFNLALLIFLGVLLWFDKITKELAAGLIGSLFGYWYGNRQGKN